MYLRALAPAWRDLYQQLVTQTHVLIIDREPQVVGQLQHMLEEEGYQVTLVPDFAEGADIVANDRVDLAIVEDQQPNDAGIDFIRQLRKDNNKVPCVLCTASPSAEIVTEALAAGAKDYLTKPFTDMQHLLSRIRSLVDRRATKLLFDVIVRDLSEVVESGGLADGGVTDLSKELFAFKQKLAKRTQVLIFDDEPLEAQALASALSHLDVSTQIARDPGELFALVRGREGPLSLVIALEVANASLTIKRVRREDPQLEVLATAQSAQLDSALNAVRSGATDYVLRAQEGLGPLVARVRRLVARSRRHRLYLHLVGTLYHAAKRANPALADDLVLAQAEDDTAYIRNMRPAADTLAPHPNQFSIPNDFMDGPDTNVIMVEDHEVAQTRATRPSKEDS